MSYIYDILLNFKKDLIDFYEWNINDDIIHIKKIPLYRVRRDILFDFKTKILKLDSEFLGKLFNKTEAYRGKSKKNLKYSFLIGSDEDVIAICLDNSGKIIGKSNLLLDEYDEIIEIINGVDTINISYEVIDTVNLSFKTRNELDKINYIINHINKTNIDKLKYLHYECFNVLEEDINNIKNNIKEAIQNDDNLINKIYDFYKMLSYNTK
ncbi:MAG: hypothetical protein NC181_03000 [Clostridium sp.]|nr:hypothetical protein [Clostridium sp.]MCM1444205.1 hypothetical protein [Candidatus Amulumruptor caecigallinarius]